MHLRGCFLDLDHTRRADGHTGPAAGAGIRDKLRHEGAAAAGVKPDGLGRTGIAAGLAIDIAEGETPIANRHDMIEALRRRDGKNRLGTGLRAFAAKGAFPGREIDRRKATRHGDDAGGTGFNAFCATAAGGEVAQRDPGGTDTCFPFLSAAQKVTPAERDLHRHSPSMAGRPRRPVNDLEHPDDEAIGSDKSDRQHRPDPKGQNGEGNKLPRPARLSICV
ncbi:hypothetical protein AGR6A_pAt20078 [Agrobacterium sp. NCPPB 925]|nr:hypothetical protein AGR6A_pAt20078 [Agrobacterium sp. NCPPB 925]